MRKYTVNLATNAEAKYISIRKSAADGGPSSSSATVLNTVDKLIDTILPFDPLGKNCLSSPLCTVWWISDGHVRIYYTVPPELDTIVVLRISTTARSISTLQHADEIMRQMVASGQLHPQVLKAGLRLSRSTTLH
jgi:hypothetical protein